MNILADFREKAKKMKGTIVLPESTDLRTLKATEAILKENISKVILVGNENVIVQVASENSVNIQNARIIDPDRYEKIDDFADFYFHKRKKKGITKEEANMIVRNPLYFGTLLVKFDIVNGMVAGAATATAEVLRAALQIVGVAPGLKTVSSTFIMVTSHFEEDKVFLFSDCAVVPNPDAEQLADISISSAKTRRKLLGDEPKVALLSFSTKGSAEHELIDKVLETKTILDNRNVDFDYDGELQLDAAIIPAIANKKAPDSKVAGNANVLIFPDLQAANIGYKLVQRFSNTEAIGPIIQGLAAPICDLSRGCSWKDIYNTAALVLLISQR
ncbi:MAG: phosphate acetyltransferase [Candidatus Cloacimonadota bacterium]|nr:phosphate acetyltransferase [Candidatus Cloacimonadota bacterium]